MTPKEHSGHLSPRDRQIATKVGEIIGTGYAVGAEIKRRIISTKNGLVNQIIFSGLTPLSVRVDPLPDGNAKIVYCEHELAGFESEAINSFPRGWENIGTKMPASLAQNIATRINAKMDQLIKEKSQER